MAIIVHIDDIASMFESIPALRTLHEYLVQASKKDSCIYDRILSQSHSAHRVEAKYDLGYGMTAIEQNYGFDEKEPRYESHKKYIDFQLAIHGSEYMDVCSVRDVVLNTQYDENCDAMFYTLCGENIMRVLMRAGVLLVLFPSDIHAGGIKAHDERVYKSVIKVPIDVLGLCL